MGDCRTFYDEVRFDVRNPDVTHVYVFIRGEGDCPYFVQGWHHKEFPASLPTLEIHALIFQFGDDPVLWERAEPPRTA